MQPRHRLLYTTFLAPLLILVSGFTFGSPSWEEIDRLISRQYPKVAHVEIDALHAALLRGEKPLLIDARAPEEYAVSHLPGAINLTAAKEVPPDKDREIVVYCSVGVRSASLAQQLQELGFTNVRNLRGSIFAWANRGYPLRSGTTEVRAVHPFDRKWGRLVDNQLHQYQPGPSSQ